VWGSGCIDPRFLDPGTNCRWVVSFTPRPLYLRGKSPQYPLDRRLGRPQNQFGKHWEENNFWLYRDSNSDPWAIQPVASSYTDCDIRAPYNRELILCWPGKRIGFNYEFKAETVEKKLCVRFRLFCDLFYVFLFPFSVPYVSHFHGPFLHFVFNIHLFFISLYLLSFHSLPNNFFLQGIF
jgi:hypothetical protein